MSERCWHLPTHQFVTALELNQDWVTVRYPDDSVGTVPKGTLIRDPDKKGSPSDA